MRDELLNPVSASAQLESVNALTERLYRLHEAGRDYSSELEELAKLVGKPVSKFDVDAAFGSISPQTFALGLMPVEIPVGLTDAEMIEMVQRICKASGTEFQTDFWLRCLKANTGDPRISDLIFWPDEYFGDGNVKRKMSPREILDTALKAGRDARS